MDATPFRNECLTEKPGEVNISCIVYNWRRMNCTWPPLDTGIPVFYKLYYTYSPNSRR